MTRRSVAVLAGVVALLVAVGAIAFAASGNLGMVVPQERRTAPAPIDGLEIRVLESYPAQYVLGVKAGLPSGCAKADSYTVTRAGETITVTVLNSIPAGNPICTAIYGTYELNINLGSDFRSGTAYTVQVNDKATTFRAQ
jgi:hypothetical protein